MGCQTETEKSLHFFIHFVQDTTQWELMDAKELEKRLKVYKASGDFEDFAKVMSCLRLAHIYYCEVKGYTDCHCAQMINGAHYWPLLTSPDLLDTEQGKTYQCIEADIYDICDFLKDEESLAGIVINPKTDCFVLETDKLFENLNRLDAMEDYIDKMMEDGFSEDVFIKLMFERFDGRRVQIETKSGEIIEGESWVHFKDCEEDWMQIRRDKEDSVQVDRVDIKRIKAFPLE